MKAKRNTAASVKDQIDALLLSTGAQLFQAGSYFTDVCGNML